MSRCVTPATAVRYPQIDLEEVTRRRLHESPLVSAPDKEALMSTTTTSSRTSYVQWLIESRPPSLVWSRSTPPQPNQPPLDLTDQEANDAEVAASDNRGVRVSGQGGLGRPTTTRTTRCPEMEYHTCFGADSGAAGPASGCSGLAENVP
jgi:hypothetical protein